MGDLLLLWQIQISARQRNNGIQRDNRPVLHDQNFLRNGDVPHPACHGHIRAASLPLVRDKVFDGRLRMLRQTGDERGETAVQFFGLLRVQFAPFGGQPGCFSPAASS